MPFFSRDGIGIYYEVHGRGTPLFLTHGFSATSEMWREQIAPLSKHFKLIVWDMRGHGKSGYPRSRSAYSEAHTVADIDALLTHLCGSQQAIIGGLSLGGYMSLAYHRVHPERCKALLIIDAGPGFKKDAAREFWNEHAIKAAKDFDRYGLQASYLKHASRDVKGSTHRNANGLALAARGVLAQRNADVINSLENVKVPSLVVVGENDKPFFAATDYIAKKIPACEKTVVPRAGHAVNIDNPQGFLDGVMPFLEKIEGRSAKL